MKGILLLLSFLLAGTGVFSQQTPDVIDSTMVYEYTSPTDSTLHSKHVYTYDSNENMTLDVYYALHSSLNMVKYYKDEYTYDSNGNETSSTQ